MRKNKTIKDIYNSKLACLYMFSNGIFCVTCFICFKVFYSMLPLWFLVFAIFDVLILIGCSFLEKSLNKKYIKEVIYNEEANR